MNEKKHANAPQVRKNQATDRSRLRSQPAQGAFSDLIPDIQRAVAAQGYTQPTPIQEQCIGHLLEGRDLLGSAQTGTGKTAAFSLPLLQRLFANYRKPRNGTPRALILAPTRELAAQIGENIGTYGRFLPLRHAVIFGGVNQSSQVRALRGGIDILVATPGRLLDLMQQGFIHLNKVEVFILDEGDRMLDMGFIPDIKRVLAEIPAKRQTLFFSATLPPKIVQLANTMVKDPIRVTIAPDKPTVERINQKVLFVGKNNKNALLVSLLGDPQISKAIVFTQMKHVANQLVKKLLNVGIDGVAIHGNKSQAARTKALDGFKRGQFQVLVATDVAARGLDVDDISHVINYDLPIEAETYVHRIGRTARAGADGDAISLCCAEDRAYLNDIEKLLGKPVPADIDHNYHCDEAYRSKQLAPKNFGRSSGGRSRSGQRRSSGRGQARPTAKTSAKSARPSRKKRQRRAPRG
jgi:ATP-dependent RNA helicase RhlE